MLCDLFTERFFLGGLFRSRCSQPVRSCSGYDFSEAAGITAPAQTSSSCLRPSPRSSSHVQFLILSAMRSGLSQIVYSVVPHGFLSVSLVGLDGLGLGFSLALGDCLTQS